MARKKIVLDEWKGHIEQWAKSGLRKEEIQRRLQEQANITIGLSTLSTQLRIWGVRYNRSPIQKSDALRERVKQLFHAHPNMKDEETVHILHEEGFQISGTRALARLRKEAGLFRRVEKSQEDKVKMEVIEALRQEFGDNFELPDDIATRDLSVYLRSKYNLVGRDRIRRIAAEVNPGWVQKRKQKGQFPRAASAADEEMVHETGDFSATTIDTASSYEATRPRDTFGGHGITIRDGTAHYLPSSSTAFPNDFDLVPDWLDPSLLDSG